MPFNDNSFLGELWGDISEGEKGDKHEIDPVMEIYFEMKEKAERNPELSELLKDVENCVLRYAASVAALGASKIDYKKEELGASDQNRRIAHDALIDALNILSRAFAKAGLDNRWRQMVGLDRKEVTEWGLKIANYLRQTTLGGNFEP